MYKKLGLLWIIVMLGGVLVWPLAIFAGFGISPPYVKGENVSRGATFEQQIFLVRGDPVNDLKAEIVLNTAGFEDWFEIDRGTEFILPRGQTKIPMTVKVTVPSDADYKHYAGNIKIRTAPVTSGGGGSVSIALGAQIDVDITVVDEDIRDFRVRKISISDLNPGRHIGWLYFPGKIQFGITIENTGNVPVAPTAVVFDIYDSTGRELLEQMQNTNRIEKVAPFDTKEVFAEFPTELPPGGYFVRYRIFNNDVIKQEGELNLSIVSPGTVAAAGYGFFGLSTAHKATIVLPILALLLLIVFFFRRAGRASRKSA